MVDSQLRYWARLYFYDDGVILVKQTIKNSKGNYVIHHDTNGNQKERHINRGDDQALVEAIRLAGQGML